MRAPGRCAGAAAGDTHAPLAHAGFNAIPEPCNVAAQSRYPQRLPKPAAIAAAQAHIEGDIVGKHKVRCVHIRHNVPADLSGRMQRGSVDEHISLTGVKAGKRCGQCALAGPHRPGDADDLTGKG